MDHEEQLIALLAIVIICMTTKQEDRALQRRGHAHGFSDEHVLAHAMPWCSNWLTKNPDAFKNFVRMTPESFNDFLNRIRPHIDRHDTNMREATRDRFQRDNNCAYLDLQQAAILTPSLNRGEQRGK